MFSIILTSISFIFMFSFIAALVTAFAIFVYTLPMFIYMSFKNYEYHKDYQYKRELTNATRIYKAWLRGKDTVELL